MSAVATRLKELNIELPTLSKPAANYVPFVVSGNQVVISGQIPFVNGKVDGQTGKLGADCDIERGKKVARQCAVNILAQLREACGGNLDKVKRCVRLGVFVNSTPDFTQHPVVANGASDFMVEVFGKKGEHARFAVGVAALPFGVAVEADAVFEIE